MKVIYLIRWIATIVYFISGLGTLYYILIIYKNKKIFSHYIHDEYGQKNPLEIVPDEDAKKIQRKYNQLFTKPAKIAIFFSIISILSAIISNFL